jgi:hypothetical protein
MRGRSCSQLRGDPRLTRYRHRGGRYRNLRPSCACCNRGWREANRTAEILALHGMRTNAGASPWRATEQRLHAVAPLLLLVHLGRLLAGAETPASVPPEACPVGREYAQTARMRSSRCGQDADSRSSSNPRSADAQRPDVCSCLNAIVAARTSRLARRAMSGSPPGLFQRGREVRTGFISCPRAWTVSMTSRLSMPAGKRT